MRQPTWQDRIERIAPQDVDILKPDGTTRTAVKARIVRDPDEIIITCSEAIVPIARGDTIVRHTPAGPERLKVVDPGWQPSYNASMPIGHPEHYAIRYVLEADGEHDVAAKPVPSSGPVVGPVHADRVFVVHGRDKRLQMEVERFLRSVGLKPIEWEQARGMTRKPTPFTWEIVDAAFREAAAIVVLFSPDDEAKLRSAYLTPDDEPFEAELTAQPRPNVLFEAGVAYGRDPGRTVIVSVGRIRPISDLSGHHITRLTSTPASRKALAERLADAGCTVDMSGSAWLEAGNFAANVPHLSRRTDRPCAQPGNLASALDFLGDLDSDPAPEQTPVPQPASATWLDILRALTEAKELLTRRATGGYADASRYQEVRNLLVRHEGSARLIPAMVRDYRTPNEFWDYIKGLAPTYKDRRETIREAFAEALQSVENEVWAEDEVSKEPRTEG